MCVDVCRRGKQLEESDQYTLKGRGTMLTVRNIRQDDGGSYSCKASNKAGEAEQELFLKVFGKKGYAAHIYSTRDTPLT